MTRSTDDILDELLVIEAQRGDAEAFARLVRRWHGPFLRHACRHGDPASAPDAVQDAWLTIARGLGRLRDPALFRRWAYRIIGRRCADAARRAGRRDAAEDARRRELFEGTGRPAGDDPEVEELREALGRMAAADRMLLAMLYVDGMSVAEIADALELPRGTVKSRLWSARRKLAGILERSRT